MSDEIPMTDLIAAEKLKAVEDWLSEHLIICGFSIQEVKAIPPEKFAEYCMAMGRTIRYTQQSLEDGRTLYAFYCNDEKIGYTLVLDQSISDGLLSIIITKELVNDNPVL